MKDEHSAQQPILPGPGSALPPVTNPPHCEHTRLKFRGTLAAVCLLALSFFVAAPAPAALFTDLLVFGDSLSDHGNDLNFTTYPKAPGYSDGRFSNGPLWVERLGTLLGLGAPTSSRGGGKDFAYGGVTTGAGTTQLNSYYPLGPDYSAPNIGKQVTDWTSANTAAGSQLFTMLGGGNDFFAVLDNGAATTAQSVADNMKSNIQALYDDGARNVLALNLPDLGKTPRYRGTAKAAQATKLTTDYNAALTLNLNALKQADAGLNIYALDLFGLLNDVIANPATYGLANVTDRAYTGDDSFAGNGTAVADPSKYLFWDAVHPTTAAHTLIGNAAFSLVPEPGSALLFLFFGLLFGCVRASRAQRRAA